jgi:uncharacterized protein
LRMESPLGFGLIGEREDFRQQEPWDSRKEVENGWKRGMPSLPLSVSGTILIACIAVYLLSQVAPDFVYGYLALIPAYMFQRPWTLVTYMFVHASFDHLLWNMLFLFFFGIELERRVGSKTFLVIYLLSGIIAALVQIFVFPSILVGASGALYGIMGCLAVIAPEIRVLIFFVIPLSIRGAIILFAAIEFLSFGAADNIAHMAHFAGLIVGVAFGYAMRKHPKYNYNI